MNKIITERQVPLINQALLNYHHPVLARIYAARGIQHSREIERELADLLPYNQLLEIDQAVTCLHEALKEDKAILIIGDYDADGATSTALAVKALRAMGATRVDYLVPNRFTYGYGLTPALVELALTRNPQPDLLITVDNGVASLTGVAKAKSAGLKIIITDHHLPGETLPEADAMVNPNQPHDLFPSKCIAGVGVIFYVMLALRAHLRKINWFNERHLPEPNMGDYLDLVALGTVADVVPLDKNNRILVHQGLKRIREGRACQGIQALLTLAKRPLHRLVATDLGYGAGPRLNAAGRMDDMSIGIACLLSNDFNQAMALAKQLDDLNHERRTVEAKMQTQAWEALNKLVLPQQNETTLGLCLFHKEWHQGVIGIVAGRIKDQFHRPVIAFACGEEGMLKGSARSVEGVHIRNILEAISIRYPTMITAFGGHAMAAGLSLAQSYLTDFSTAFDEEVRRHLSPKDLQGRVITDGVLNIDEFNLELAKTLRQGGPWGQGFPEPLFRGRFTLVEQRIVGAKHLKMSLSYAKNANLLSAIAFFVDLEQWPNHRCHSIEAAFRLDVNEYQGIEQVQLLIEYFHAVS